MLNFEKQMTFIDLMKDFAGTMYEELKVVWETNFGDEFAKNVIGKVPWPFGEIIMLRMKVNDMRRKQVETLNMYTNGYKVLLNEMLRVGDRIRTLLSEDVHLKPETREQLQEILKMVSQGVDDADYLKKEMKKRCYQTYSSKK